MMLDVALPSRWRFATGAGTAEETFRQGNGKDNPSQNGSAVI
jgi:hypothetical protein